MQGRRGVQSKEAEMSWQDNEASKMRREAKAALRQYPKAKRRQSETGEMRITPAYNGMPGGGTASRTTEDVALAVNLTPHEENVISAVEFAMRMQSVYPNGQERIKMIELVYFKRTHTLEGAAMECHYADRTVKRWNNEILTAVYVALKK